MFWIFLVMGNSNFFKQNWTYYTFADADTFTKLFTFLCYLFLNFKAISLCYQNNTYLILYYVYYTIIIQ